MRRTDERFANDIRAALQRGGVVSFWPVLIVLSAILVAAIVWARLAVLEEVTRGGGRVIPSSQVQIVQSLEGGIVSEIAIAEGDRVAAGEPLMRIDDTSFSAELGEVRNRQEALEAKRIRLAAEVAGTEPDFSAADLPEAVVAQEQALMESRRAALKQELAVADHAPTAVRVVPDRARPGGEQSLT